MKVIAADVAWLRQHDVQVALRLQVGGVQRLEHLTAFIDRAPQLLDAYRRYVSV